MIITLLLLHRRLQEIVLAITAEYTDWARPVQHPVNIRDLTAEALHDACYVSPVTVSANQLYTPARSSYLYVLDYRPSDPDPVVSVCHRTQNAVLSYKPA